MAAKQDVPSADDYKWMAEALRLAKNGEYTTTPNPRVGCIIIDKEQQKVGQGYHVQAGSPHAEVYALQEAKERAKGATAYVTLEPCSHYGRTPPCAEALIAAGVSKVVVAMTDPNPQVSGQGLNMLRDAGVTVVSGVLEQQATALNRGFIKRMTTGKPWVTVKLGVSLDGKIALANGQSQWITSALARRDVQRHRARSCAILTGSGTARIDDPSLLVRANEAQLNGYPLATTRQPLRVVIDSKNQLDSHLTLFTDGHKTLKVCGQGLAPETENTTTVSMQSEQLNLAEVITLLGEKQINELWVEAGPGLAGALFRANEVDELVVYQAPKLLGDKGQSMLILDEFTHLSQTPSLHLTDLRQIGPDIKMTYLVGNKTN
ncbi:bifunctional diaminohydroxyphosphoribosylaminopyrimidine deaminase/5-amino-6-(5-phosphoribosylamino)uracil reductase RibD [Alteromonas sp. C1M14]|uniref:bifunctional diaminohydroxyphosphoribosylaminopyrimidine deaminase/5-amino-6-(5-phosphoribosylamino)uracil reductase RibD n=1 Tax=Alteromonas sp. C1M14 TaxID=2841567 RepID=UPI001C089099|nr:bifunctional diaminohydroxyphosphoribosylaminopyrimidine deaminase/5-amino-6-(5-phosphoribosylamino)uracil reductase RibD [Alteromonas sp. C1M14]MBU2979067.1 bifunctional diaminohydroxyphosphoribosylaminopyrimidine deaminase/5-amino-6-(5-phosphoribosylamino)uracil reductase RibD [Alteromonas sp. C1M14]